MLSGLRLASAYASASADRGIDMRQTHMSIVFLLDDSL
jgi:aminoglycoside phosphotransferase family enzyme